MDDKQHIVSFSGGKDSTAMLFIMLEKGMRIDRIINVDTTKEFPQMHDHIAKVQSMIDIPIETVKIDFDYWQYGHIIKNGKRKGEHGYGWSSSLRRWCTTAKIDALNHLRLNKPYNRRKISEIKYDKNMFVEYHGIALDEPKRIKNIENTKYPLVDFGITEKEALKYCYSLGLDWGGLYAEGRSRVSCYCCPLQRIGELKLTYIHHKDLWENILRMDKKTTNKFKDRYTVKDLDRRFYLETQYNDSLLNQTKLVNNNPSFFKHLER